MLTHVHKVVITCWCWHICEGGGVWAVERVWVPFSLPPSVRARDSGDFGEVKCLFSTTPEVGKETEANAVTEVTGRSTGRSTGRCTGRCTGRGHCGPARPVSAARASGARARVWHRRVRWPTVPARPVWRTVSHVVFGRGARPVTHHRTRPVVQGAYWTRTGRGYCGVRWLRGARPVVASRARVLCAPARPVVRSSASGGSFDR